LVVAQAAEAQTLMVGHSEGVLAIIPAHDEGPRIGAVVRALVDQGLPVLVVDDGSSDETADQARAAGAGKGAALKAGFEEALSPAADPPCEAILTLDGDGQHDPREAPSLLKAWRDEDADLVVGARDYLQMPPIRWFTNSLSKLLFSWAVGVKIPDNQSGYRLRTRRVAEADLASTEQGFAFEVEEIAICAGRGYRLTWVPIKTIYGTETSDIRAWSHFVSFLRVTRRARQRARKERRAGPI
jgi:glycosyltransferase involved in cell wall biosynthesis